MSDFQSKIIDVKELLTEVNVLLEKQKTALNETAKSIEKYGKASKGVPSDYLIAQKESIELQKQQIQLQKQQSTLNAKVEIDKIKIAKAELGYANAVKGSALANKKLADAYGELSAKRNASARALQNLIASEKASSAEIRKAQKEFDILNKKVAQADNAIGKLSQANGGLKNLTSTVSNLMGAFGIATGLYLAVDIGKNIYETTKQLQSLDLALKMVSGTQEEFASNQAFIAGTAEKWGIEIKGLTEQYTQFYTASKGILSTAKIKEVFESIAKSGALMGLSVEKQNNAFYAFEQMMSKGVVSAEELKKQLGNAMPGAMKAAGMAYMELHPKIKSIQEAEGALMKEMKAGAIDSATYVPLIVKNFEKLYGIEMVNKVNTLQASQERLLNSWTELVRAMSIADTGTVMGQTLIGMTTIAEGLLSVLTKIISSQKLLMEGAKSQGQIKATNLLSGSPIEDEAKQFGGTTKESQKKFIEKRIKENYDEWKASVDKYNELAKEYNEKGGFGQYWAINLKSNMDSASESIGYFKELYDRYKDYLNPDKTGVKLVGGETEAQRKKRLAEEAKAEKDRLKALEESMKVTSVIAGKFELSKEQDTALEKLKQLKEALEKTRDETAKNAVEFAQFEKSISDVNKAIDVITKPLKTDITAELEASVKPYNEKRKRELKEMKDAIAEASVVFNEFVGSFADKSGFKETFDLMSQLDEDGLTHFEKMEDGAKKTFMAISTVAQDAFNMIAEASSRSFEEERNRLEKQKDIAIEFAGDSDSAKKKIEEDYEKRQREIDRREFKRKQQIAMVNIAIDTAQAVANTIGKTGFFGIPLAIIVGALGATQLALVASQKPPEYFTGTDNAEEGMAWTQERGAEIITDKKGNIKDFGSNKGAKLTKMSAGDVVYTAEETKRLMFQNDYHNLLSSNGIGEPVIQVNNGITYAEMDEIIGKHLGNIQTQNLDLNKDGFNFYVSNGHNRTIINSNRVSGKGVIV